LLVATHADASANCALRLRREVNDVLELLSQQSRHAIAAGEIELHKLKAGKGLH
jgi:hypothetical protein